MSVRMLTPPCFWPHRDYTYGMLIFYENAHLYADTTKTEDRTAKALQMSWNEEAGLWQLHTSCLPQLPLSKLERLLKHADDSAKEVLEPFFRQEKNQVALSEASDLHVQLRAPKRLDYMPFQKAGIAYALSRKDTLIADEMGLGKTVQAIGVVNNAPHIKTVVVVCPASLKLNWAKEFEKWCVRKPFIRVLAPKGDLQTIGDPFIAQTSVMIANYEIIEKISSTLPEKIDLLVADEAHYIKNKHTKRADALRKLAVKSEKKIFLTGTPILNRPIEIWNILDTLQPTSWGSEEAFGIRYADGHKKHVGNGKVIWNFKGASNLDELHEKLRRNIMVRRMKSDVLSDLPDKVRQIVPLDVNYKESGKNAQRTARLKKIWQKAERANSDKAYKDAISDLDSEFKVDFEDIARVRHEIAQKKAPHVTQFVKDMLENIDKVVVFAHHKDVVEHLAKSLKEFGVVTLTGNDSLNQKQKAVEAFQKDPNIRVFIGNILAAGTGHTLTAAQHVVFAELDWVPGNVKQAEDRCHRIGQTDTVFVYHLVVDNSLDVILASTIVAKMEIEAAALGKGNGGKRSEVTRNTLRSKTQSFPFYTDLEKKAMRYALLELAKRFTKEDANIGKKLCTRILKSKELSDKHYAYAYKMLEKYAKSKISLKFVRVLYPKVAKWRQEQKRKRKAALSYAKTDTYSPLPSSVVPHSTEQVIQHDPLWGEADVDWF